MRDRCFHCGAPFIGSVTVYTVSAKNEQVRFWCKSCATAGGTCAYCNRDVTENAGCWGIKQELDKAALMGRFTSSSCRVCGTQMALSITQVSGDTITGARFDCPECRTYLIMQWHIASRGPDTTKSS